MKAFILVLIFCFLLFSVLFYLLHKIKIVDDKIESIYKNEYERKNNNSKTEENI